MNNWCYRLEKWVLDAETDWPDGCSTHLSLLLSLCVCSSKQTYLCVRVTVSSHTHTHTHWERTVNAQTTQNGAVFFLFFPPLFFSEWKREKDASVLWYSPDSPLSWSVIQQKNGSIKSWSSSCQVTPRKWVLKLFFFPFYFFFLAERDGGNRRRSVFKVRKWKLCFLMSCLSGCLCVWWSVKCSVTLTKWPWLCCCGFEWPPPHGPSSASILLGINGKAGMEDIHKYCNCTKSGCLSSALIIYNDSKGPTVHSILNSFPPSPYWVTGSKCSLRCSIKSVSVVVVVVF